MPKRSLRRQNVPDFFCLLKSSSILFWLYVNALLFGELCFQYKLTFYARRVLEVKENCLEILQVFKVAYFALAVNWLLCDSNFVFF